MKAIPRVLRRQTFGLAILACAAVAFAFPAAFTEWGGVKLTSLVVPAIQLIMFGMGTTLSLGDFLRVVKRLWIGWGTDPAKRAFYGAFCDFNPLNDL